MNSRKRCGSQTSVDHVLSYLGGKLFQLLPKQIRLGRAAQGDARQEVIHYVIAHRFA
jgi:hypothetical protein